MEIPRQRRAAANKDLANLGRSRPWVIRTPIKFGTDVDGLPPSRVNGIPKIFNRMRPSPDTKGKERQHRANIMTPDTVNVPLGLATYVCVFFFFRSCFIRRLLLLLFFIRC